MGMCSNWSLFNKKFLNMGPIFYKKIPTHASYFLKKKKKSLHMDPFSRLRQYFCFRYISDSNNIILWHESEDINKKIKLIPKISVDSNSSYAWLYVFHCSNRLLWWIKVSSTKLSVKIALILYWKDFSLIPLGKCAS